MSVSTAANETTFRNAVNEVQSKIQTASQRSVHIYSFNVPLDQLQSAHALLDRQKERKSMKVTYSDSNNFIIRYMPGSPHEAATSVWLLAVVDALRRLTPPPGTLVPPGCTSVGATTFQFGERKKQADAGLRPITSRRPSVVLEVGDSESLNQLKIDARLWIEHTTELVMLLSIDPPRRPFPNFPTITVELWRGVAPTAASRQRKAEVVWSSDWTDAATPLYILLADIFGAQVPAVYGNNDRVQLDTACIRQEILNSYFV